MAHSNYSYVRHEGVVSIIDEYEGGAGNKTVTNNIEQVIDDISRQEEIDPWNYVWVYMDSEGLWSGYEPEFDNFYRIGAMGADELDTVLSSNQVKQRIRL